MTHSTEPTALPPEAPKPSRSSRLLRWPLVGAALIVVLAVAALSSFETGSDGSDVQVTGEEKGTHDADQHTPRPSGDDAQRPAPADRGWVEIGGDVVADVSEPRSRPVDLPTAEPAHRSGGSAGGAPSARLDRAAPASAPLAPPTPRPGEQTPPVGGPLPGDDPLDAEHPQDPHPAEEQPVPSFSGRYQPPSPSRDQMRCPDLDMVAIGDLPEDADAELRAFGPRFRDLAAAELARAELVCAGPIHRWRDLVIQRLFIGTSPEGTLAASADGHGDVVRFTFPEWKGYRLTGEDDFPFNLGGRPTGRETFTDHSIVRTTNGGLVSRRPDTHGFLVINGAWTLWADQNGRATMGYPETQPALSGTLGIYQDFSHGWIQIPGVLNPFEAEHLGPEAYVWHPVPDPMAHVPPDATGNILEVNETSWFIDREGVRHWIPDKREYDCARAEHSTLR